MAAACQALDDEAAAAMAGHIGALHAALKLVDRPERLADWTAVLGRLADADGVHARVRGLAARLLLDERQADAADRMSRALSRAVPPEAAAAWLEGFLGGGGMLQAHDEALFQLLDQWVVGLSADHFIQVLPPAAAAPAASWDLDRAERLIPTLSLILGIKTDESG